MLTLLARTISAVLSLFRLFASARLRYVCILWPSREKYKYFPEKGKQCKPIHYAFDKVILEHVVHSAPFIAALIINTIINIKIVQRLRRPPPGENGNQQNQQIKRRITWMLLANSVIFFFCLAPRNFLLIFGKLMNLSNYEQDYNLYLTFTFVMVNSAINPILYGIVSPSYRRGFFNAFGFAKNKIEPVEEQATERTTAT